MKKRQGIYIMSSTREPGLYKIGISNGVKRRQRQIDDSMPGGINTLFFLPMRNARRVEKRLHGLHRSIHAPRKSGSGRTEWFDPGATSVWPFIGAACGAVAFFFLPYGKSAETLLLCSIIGFLGYGVVFVAVNVVMMIAERLYELLPIIAIAFLLWYFNW